MADYLPTASPCSDTTVAKSLMIWFTSNKSLCGKQDDSHEAPGGCRCRGQAHGHQRALRGSQEPGMSPESPYKSESRLGSKYSLLTPRSHLKLSEHPRAKSSSLGTDPGPAPGGLQSSAGQCPTLCCRPGRGAKRLSRAEHSVYTAYRPTSPIVTSLSYSLGNSLTEGSCLSLSG